MRHSPLSLLCAVALVATACTGVDDLASLRDRAGEVGGQVTEVADRARFCFAVTRSLAGIDGGTTPEQAYEAAEEVLAQAPDELRDDAEVVASTLRRAAEDGETEALGEQRFRDAADRLRADTRELCDPR